jgi:Zn-dependent M28 family amino/carboxypeptidase
MRVSIAHVALLAAVSFGVTAPVLAENFEAKNLAEHIRVLASDEFEGRGPATPGEVKSVDYIIKQFKALGLQPGGLNGSWTQMAKLNRFEISGPVTMQAKAGDWTKPLGQGEEVTLSSRLPASQVHLDNVPVVFVGYGIDAPEQNWDDFKGVDVKGKIILVLVNDPGFDGQGPQPSETRVMSYYGRWTYKFEEGARRGAAGVLVIHHTETAGYGWNTVRNSWGQPQFDVERKNAKAERVALEGWIQENVAAELCAKAGLDLSALTTAAASKDFKPVALKGVSLSAQFKLDTSLIESANVLGLIKGTKHPDETVVYSAHWDHLGIGPADATGDRIHHGAVDNATGISGLIELARAFKSAPAPERSVLFLAVTAEEKNLLGSEYYASHPVYPLGRTVADLNMDGLAVSGPAKDIVLVGAGKVSLEEDTTAIAAKYGLSITPDPFAVFGSYFRSDQFSFARHGVPGLHIASGYDLVEGGIAAGKAKAREYLTTRYHQPADKFDPNWDFRGMVQQLTVYYDLGQSLANSRTWPDWKPKSEFAQARLKSAKDRQGP